jgi:hypothetical protein
VPTNYPLSQDRIIVFEITSPQQKPDALQTSAPWQLKCFESSQKNAKRQIPRASGSTHNCFAKSSGISAGSCRQPQTYAKPEAVITVFELLMMSGVSLETC